MANEFNPTAANIISSLGIKGATVDKAEAGFVPVLGADGKLNANFIPATASQLSIPPLSCVAYIDPHTTVDEFAPDGTRLRVGSIVAPFKSLSEAASNFKPTDEAIAKRYVAFVLASGEYEDSGMSFATVSQANPNSLDKTLTLYLIGIGEIRFASTVTQFSIAGLAQAVFGRRPAVFIQNINIAGNVTIDSSADITILGKSHIGVLSASEGATLRLSSEAVVSETSIPTTWLADASRVGNSSSVIGDTVAGALDRLGGRKIRIAKISGSGSDIDVDTSSFVDVPAESAGDFDIFDLRDRDGTFVAALKDLYGRLTDIKCNSVDAHSVVADIVKTKELRMDSLLLGGYRLAIDSYGYLVVMDGSETPPQPPDSIVLIRDTGDSGGGAVYVLGVADGRMYVAPYDDESSEPVEYLTVYDPESGYDYRVSMSDGRLIITRVESTRRTQRKRGGK